MPNFKITCVLVIEETNDYLVNGIIEADSEDKIFERLKKDGRKALRSLDHETHIGVSPGTIEKVHLVGLLDVRPE